MSQDTQFGQSRLLRDLRADTATITDAVATRIGHDDMDYGTGALGRDELLTLVADSCAAWLDALAEGPYSLEPARRAGRLKAERGIPLESLLHAYRLAGLAFWEIIVEYAGHGDRGRLPRLSTLMWATVDAYSVAAAEAYRRVATAGTALPDQGLLRALLDPDLPPKQREAVGRTMRLPTRMTAVVLVGDLDLPATTVTTASTVLGDDRVTLVAATSPAALERAVRTVQARAGASRPFTAVAEAPAALAQARLAFRCSGPADAGIHRYASAPERALIAANPALAADVFAEILAALDRLEPADAGILVDTALAWYDCGGSTAAVGTRLHLHRNTVLQRLKRMERLTGKAFARPADAALLYMALQFRLLRNPRP